MFFICHLCVLDLSLNQISTQSTESLGHGKLIVEEDVFMVSLFSKLEVTKNLLILCFKQDVNLPMDKSQSRSTSEGSGSHRKSYIIFVVA